MKVNIISGEDIEVIEVNHTTIREILSYLKFLKGEEFTNKLLITRFAFLAQTENEEIITLRKEVIDGDLSSFKELYLVKEISGEVPVPLVAAVFMTEAAWAAADLGTTLAVYALAATINAGISIGLQMLMNALSPTPKFSGDAAQAQTLTSNLFNGAKIVMEQGGSVPLLYGHAFAGGTLICSSVTTIQG